MSPQMSPESVSDVVESPPTAQGPTSGIRYFEAFCPQCRHPLRIRTEYAGQRVACNYCDELFLAWYQGEPNPEARVTTPGSREADSPADSPFRSHSSIAGGPSPGKSGIDRGAPSAELGTAARQLRDTLALLDLLQGQVQDLQAQLEQARAQPLRDESLQQELEAARAERESFRRELEAVRAERDRLHALIVALRDLLDGAGPGEMSGAPRLEANGDRRGGSQDIDAQAEGPARCLPGIGEDPRSADPDQDQDLGAGPPLGPGRNGCRGDDALFGDLRIEATPDAEEATSPPPTPRHGPAPTIRIPGYQCLELLCDGAMGRVYKARQMSLDRTVAIKILHPRMTTRPEMLARFRREAKIVSSLSHPNIIHAIDAGEVDGHPYFVMEYVVGETIEDYLARHPHFDEPTAIKVALALADALGHAQRRGLVHRDIKPANVILSSEGLVKLIDLGLARLFTSEEWASADAGLAVGTPEYISPEQARGQADVDIRSDIYSLGATLYRMVTGRVPYGGATPSEALHRHLDAELALVPPEQINPALSRGLGAVIGRMLARNREDRYRCPEDLILDLRRLLPEDRPALAEFQIEDDAPRPLRDAPARPDRRAPDLRSGW